MRITRTVAALALGLCVSGGLLAPAASATPAPAPAPASAETVRENARYITTGDFEVPGGETVTKTLTAPSKFPDIVAIAVPGHQPGEPRLEYSKPKVTGSGTAEDPHVLTVEVTNPTDEPLTGELFAKVDNK